MKSDVKLKPKGERTIGDQAGPDITDLVMLGTVAKEEPIADNDSEHASDSDVMVVEEVGSQGSDTGNRFWPSDDGEYDRH